MECIPHLGWRYPVNIDVSSLPILSSILKEKFAGATEEPKKITLSKDEFEDAIDLAIQITLKRLLAGDVPTV